MYVLNILVMFFVYFPALCSPSSDGGAGEDKDEVNDFSRCRQL